MSRGQSVLDAPWSHMLVSGQRCPVVGRVRMDQTVRDVTDAPGAAVGDEVVVIGRQGRVHRSRRGSLSRRDQRLRNALPHHAACPA